MAVTVQFYHNKSDPRVIGKTLENIGTFQNVKVWEPSTLNTPKLLMVYNAEVFASNYCHIGPPFNRYYFCSPATVLPGGKMCIPLFVDVRETWKEDIRKLEPVILRRQDKCDGMLTDEYIETKPAYVADYQPFDYNTFGDGLYNYVVEVVGE